MITYTYIVRCPECEDEFFDFFDEAKDFALGCLTKKPIITQTEVQRNDFGECTDHCDLGTVWSWEDMMKDVETESADTVFSKAETFGISEGIDDFDDFDIGPQIDEFTFDDIFAVDEDEVVEDPIEPVEEAMSKVQADYLSRRKPMTKEEFAERLEAEDEILIFTGDPRELGIRGRDYFAAKVDGKYEVSFWDETYEDEFTDSEVVETFDTIDELWAYMVDFMEDDDFNPEYNYLAEACAKKPIPEGMTIEQLQEEMEDNEDTVECSKCGNLVEKANCHHNQEGFGWCCNTCEPADTLAVEPEELHDLGNTYDGGYPEDDALIEAQSAPIPNFIYLAEEAGARDMLINELRSQKVFGITASSDGSVKVNVYVAFDYWGTTIKDITVTPNGRIMLDCEDTRAAGQIKQRDLQTLVNSKPKKGDGSKFLTALKAAATKLNKELDTRTRRERRDDAVGVRVTDEVAEYLRDHTTNIHFKIPMQTYDLADIKDIEANSAASDEACEVAANRINNIHERFFSQPFADAAVDAGMVSDRVPNEPAAWISSSWGAECKFTFDRPIKELVINKGTDNEVKISDIIQAYQWKASTKINVEKNTVDCFSLAVRLITHFDNDVRFFEKKAVTEDVENEFDLDFPEVEN